LGVARWRRTQRFAVYRANVAQMVSELGWELPSGEW
jgi:hypothetical protein